MHYVLRCESSVKQVVSEWWFWLIQLGMWDEMDNWKEMIETKDRISNKKLRKASSIGKWFFWFLWKICRITSFQTMLCPRSLCFPPSSNVSHRAPSEPSKNQQFSCMGAQILPVEVANVHSLVGKGRMGSYSLGGTKGSVADTRCSHAHVSNMEGNHVGQHKAQADEWALGRLSIGRSPSKRSSWVLLLMHKHGRLQ